MEELENSGTEEITTEQPAEGTETASGAPDLAEMAAAVAARKAEKAKARGLPPPKPKAPTAPAAKTAPTKGPDGKFQKRTPAPAVAPLAEETPEPVTPLAEDDARPVAVGERVKFRQEQREAKAKLEAERQTMLKELEGRQGRVKALEDAFAKWEQGDYDGFARDMGALSPVKREYKGWNDLGKELARRQQSPEYLEIQRLRALEAERSAKEQKAEQERKQAEETRTRQALEREHVSAIAAELTASADPQEKAAAARADIAAAVLNVQRHAWHNGERTLTPGQALREKMPDGKSILDRMREEWQFLHTVFGSSSPPVETTPEPRKGRLPAPQNAEKTPKPTLSRGSVSDATGHGKPKDRKALIQKWASQM